MRFVVIADTHVRPDTDDPGEFPANALLAGRNHHAVQIIRAVRPEFVIHLGDVVHPVPGSPGHPGANELALDAYRQLEIPMYVVPGNHDVGDKPYGWVDAPAVSPVHYEAFIERFGPRYQSFARGQCRFVLIDTSVLNTGWDTETEQWEWLETTLRAASEHRERIFVFGHYPPYLWDPGEPEHYDNLAPTVRTRLLELFERYEVEAVFSGHVHRFFHRRHGRTDLYVAPATGFVRPEYSELDSIAPDDQFGRDDRAKLGLFVVDVEESGHEIRPVRTWGRHSSEPPESVSRLTAPGWRSHLGVTMRQAWAGPRDLAMDGLDRFVRKRVRDDSAVLALWESRISHVRVPLADLLDSDSRQRLTELAARGTEITVVVPGPDQLAEVPDTGPVSRWEIALSPGQRRPVSAGVAGPGLTAVGPLAPLTGREWSGEHFVSHGFVPDADPARVEAAVGDGDEAVFRVRPSEPVWASVGQAVDTARSAGVRALVVIELPEAGEGRMFTDETVLAARVIEAEISARAHRDCSVVLDGFADRDRGYFPRIGLVDRRGDPRAAFRAFVDFLALCDDIPTGEEPAGWQPVGSARRRFVIGTTTVDLAPTAITVSRGGQRTVLCES